MDKEYIEMLRTKYNYVKNLEKALVGAEDIKAVKYFPIILGRGTADERVEEFLCVAFNNDARCSRIATGNSNLANLQEIGKLCKGGYYEENEAMERCLNEGELIILDTDDLNGDEVKGQYIIGYLNFDKGVADIGDPGYDREEKSVLKSLKIKPGEYRCECTMDGQGVITEMVIRHKDAGEFDLTDETDFVEFVGVDAGMMSISPEKKDYLTEADWLEFCDATEKNGYPRRAIVDEMFVCTSGYGDGVYPVYIHKDANEEIDLVSVRFTDEEEE